MVSNGYSASFHFEVRTSHGHNGPFFESVSALMSLGKPLISCAWAFKLNIVVFSSPSGIILNAYSALHVTAHVSKGGLPNVCAFSRHKGFVFYSVCLIIGLRYISITNVCYVFEGTMDKRLTSTVELSTYVPGPTSWTVHPTSATVLGTLTVSGKSLTATVTMLAERTSTPGSVTSTT